MCLICNRSGKKGQQRLTSVQTGTIKIENEYESEEDVFHDTPEIIDTASSAIGSLLPEKSKSQYEREYNNFQDWRKKSQTDSLSENVLLAYFQNISKKMKPSSLWKIYSMLRMTINLIHKVDISKYPKLCAFLKRKSDGYSPKKSKILTPQQIREFISSAPDSEYLFTKVGLIFGIMGACRRVELMKIQTNHIEDLNTALLVHIPDRKTQTDREFVIGGNFYHTCKKYMALRPPNLGNNSRFFLNYQRGKCTKQPIGINKFGSLSQVVAKFLKLPDPVSYTGHCLRRSSATATASALKRHGEWLSTAIEESLY